MSRGSKRRASKRISKATKKATRPAVPAKLAILDQGEDLDKLYDIFGVTDESDLQSVVNGSVGEDW